MSTSDDSLRPQIEQRVDVPGERKRSGCDSKNLMEEDVGLQRSHEEERGGAGILHPEHAGRRGALKVVRDGGQGTARRARFVARVERKNDRRARALMHVHRNVFADRLLQEWDGLLRQPAKNDSRIRGGIGGGQFENELGRSHARGPHRLREEGLLAGGVTEQRGWRDLQLRRDGGQSGCFESLLGEDPPSGLQELRALDRRRAAHL